MPEPAKSAIFGKPSTSVTSLLIFNLSKLGAGWKLESKNKRVISDGLSTVANSWYFIFIKSGALLCISIILNLLSEVIASSESKDFFNIM